MSPTLNRQLKDIQHQAEKLISRTPSEGEIEQFNHYNEDLKAYLLEYVGAIEIRDLIYTIPTISDIETERIPLRTSVLITISIVTLGLLPFYLSYVAEMRRNKLIQENIRTARGKYASIEFLLKASD